MASVSLGLAAAITGMFGMNLASGLEEVPHGLWMCGAATWTLSGAMLVLLTSGIRRFHRSQRINVMQTASLRSVLKYENAAMPARSMRMDDGAVGSVRCMLFLLQQE